MAVRDQPTVINEAISTGVVRIELFGDKVVARTHIHEARKLTAQLRAMYGVTERIANGESGGFYQHTVELQDGTTMIATTNNGQDSVSIISVENAEDVISEVEINLVDYVPRVWVGARKISGGEAVNTGKSNSKIHLCVWEPADESRTDSGDSVLIVSNRDTLFDTVDENGDLVDSIDFRDSVRDDRSKFPLGWVEDFPEGLSRLDILTDFTDDDGVFWDVVIKTTDGVIPRSGRYDVRLMIKGEDCLETTPVVVGVKAIVFDEFGTRTVKVSTKQTIDEMTDYNKVIFPKGWFAGGEDFTQSPDACEACGAAVPDNGTNPYSSQWWQDGIVMLVSPPTSGPTPDYDFVGSTAALTAGSENGPAVGFDYDGSFPGRIDRGCSDCVVVNTIYGFRVEGITPTHIVSERPLDAGSISPKCPPEVAPETYLGLELRVNRAMLFPSTLIAAGLPSSVVARGRVSQMEVALSAVTTLEAWEAGAANKKTVSEFKAVGWPSGTCTVVFPAWFVDFNNPTEWGRAWQTASVPFVLPKPAEFMPGGFVYDTSTGFDESLYVFYSYKVSSSGVVANSFTQLKVTQEEFNELAAQDSTACSEKFLVLG